MLCMLPRHCSQGHVVLGGEARGLLGAEGAG